MMNSCVCVWLSGHAFDELSFPTTVSDPLSPPAPPGAAAPPAQYDLELHAMATKQLLEWAAELCKVGVEEVHRRKFYTCLPVSKTRAKESKAGGHFDSAVCISEAEAKKATNTI